MKYYFMPFLLLCSWLSAQSSTEIYDLSIEHLTGNVYLIAGSLDSAGGNIGVTVGPDGVLMIDAGTLQYVSTPQGLADRISQLLASVGAGAPRFLLNTHYHGDHVYLNHVYAPGATVVAHENTRRRLANSWDRGDRIIAPIDQAGWPVITFSQSMTIHFNGETIRATTWPNAHTDGDMILWFDQSNVVHTGDLFFNGTYPYLDVGAGGTIDGLIAALEHIAASIDPATIIIPGHGPPARLPDLQTHIKMLKDTRDWTAGRIRKGDQLQEVLERGFPRRFDRWNTPFLPEEYFIDPLYRSLQGELGTTP